ncbi:MAG: hypothetical protein QOD63_1904 [Actinomycetota bacterium]|jgi:hypothetical protein|nr:hypothetical protein [Actinomycetota bacterium]
MRRIVAAMSTLALSTIILSAFAAGLLLAAGPALAHEEINPSVFPTAKPTFFTLDAANEKTVGLTKVTLTAPEGLDFGTATSSPPGWSSARTDTVVTWTGGTVAPDQFEQWGFEIEGADQPGTLTYKVGLGFADGSSDDVDVVVTATSGGTAAASTGTTKDSDTNANVAFVVGILALVVALIAVILAVRKKDSRPGPGAAAAGAGKDW